jgi:SAM-dependent methyltransferase
MTNPSGAAASRTGWGEDAARTWLAGPTVAQDMHARAWQIAATVIAAAEHPVSAVLDVASGPGGFLSRLLAEFPAARGVWLDSSEVMEAQARANLIGIGDRVEFQVADILDVDKATAPGSVDVVATSRATHHLTVADLGLFYRQAASVLRPGGWVVNWDNITAGGEWDGLLRSARSRLRPASGTGAPSHPHTTKPATMEEHLAALRAAGFAEPATAWRELVTVLVLARKD